MYCTGGKWKNHKICSNPKYLDNVCSLFPIQLAKTVRLPLVWAQFLLDDIPDLKIVYLVRDPRANLQSRKGRDWCVQTPFCHNPDNLCSDLVNDYYSFLELKKSYSEIFLL